MLRLLMQTLILVFLYMEFHSGGFLDPCYLFYVLMHTTYCICDDTTIIVGSGNASTALMLINEQRNGEAQDLANC